jgi:hypothetical protein
MPSQVKATAAGLLIFGVWGLGGCAGDGSASTTGSAGAGSPSAGAGGSSGDGNTPLAGSGGTAPALAGAGGNSGAAAPELLERLQLLEQAETPEQAQAQVGRAA